MMCEIICTDFCGIYLLISFKNRENILFTYSLMLAKTHQTNTNSRYFQFLLAGGVICTLLLLMCDHVTVLRELKLKVLIWFMSVGIAAVFVLSLDSVVRWPSKFLWRVVLGLGLGYLLMLCVGIWMV